MKKLIALILFAGCVVTSNAQTATFTVTATPCHNDGVLQATFTGLTPPLTVRWFTEGTSGTTILHTDVTTLSDALTGYSGGPVTISAHDALGAIDTGSYFPGAPPFTICAASYHPAVCPGLDTLTATVCSGGTPAFTYQWYNINTTGIAGTGNPIYLPAGVYGVNVTDAAGCTYGSRVSPILVNAIYLPSFFDSISVTTANCTDGTAIVDPYVGGTLPFTFLWSNGATSNMITNLTTGNYSVKVTDANGCSDVVSAFVPQSLLITAPVTATAATCTSADGSVVALGTGGTPPYTYVWSNGATTQLQTGINAGFYGVNVTDANGCTGTDGGTVGSASPIVVTYTVTPSLCTAPTGSVTINPSGGSGAYSVQWITSPAQTGLTAINLTYGTYTYNVTDASGCMQSGTVYIPPADIISVSFASTPALCTSSTGSMTVYPVGGVAPYSYSWNTGATTSGITGKPSGDYSVTVTDVLGCKVTANQDLPYTSPVGVGFTATPASCIFTNNGMDSAVVWGGTPPYSYAWNTGATTNTIASLPPGPYWLTVTDAVGCVSNGNYSYVGYNPASTDCYCTIAGTVYADTNGDCVQDGGEIGIPNVQIYISGQGYTYTDVNGNYSYKVPAGTYSVAETVPTNYPLSVCQLNNVAVVAASGSGCLNTVSFANAVNAVHDMHISTWDYDFPKPIAGQPYSHVTLISNDGTLFEDSIAVTYNPDGALFAPTFVPGGYFSGFPYWYTNNTSALSPGATQQFFMNYSVPQNIHPGTVVVFKDTVAYKSPTDNWLLDNTPYNNISTLTTITGGSQSPNFKEVNPIGFGAAGIISYTDSVLEYMIHFQNTGNTVAENVVIIDTLDANVNATSFHPEFMSAPCQATLTQAGSKSIAKFVFSSINLPAKAGDEVRSNGMVTYTVNTKGGLPAGTQFKNRASIYFDDNAPVLTNTTLNTLGYVASHVNSVPAAQNSAFNVFPNPANNAFSAIIYSDIAGPAVMTLSDITGKALIRKSIALQKGTQNISTDVTQLASGVYFVSLEQNGKMQTQKLVIVR